MVKPPKVHMVEMEDLLQELRPHMDAMKAIAKALKEPRDFIVFPLLWASMMFDSCGDDVEQAQTNHASMSELAIIAYMAMRASARQPDSRPEPLDLETFEKPPGGKVN